MGFPVSLRPPTHRGFATESGGKQPKSALVHIVRRVAFDTLITCASAGLTLLTYNGGSLAYDKVNRLYLDYKLGRAHTEIEESAEKVKFDKLMTDPTKK